MVVVSGAKADQQRENGRVHSPGGLPQLGPCGKEAFGNLKERLNLRPRVLPDIPRYNSTGMQGTRPVGGILCRPDA